MNESESRKTHRTGLARRMREWMKSRGRRAFAPRDIADGLGLPIGKERDKLRNSIPDFLLRGEIVRVHAGKYSYNHEWSKCPVVAQLQGKVLKAIYLSVQAFTVADILRLTEAGDPSYVGRIIRRLVRAGHVVKVFERPVHQGKQHVFKLIDRVRFRMEELP